MKTYQFSCGDIIETQGHIAPRLYLVIGIHIGALNQESAIEFIPVDRSNPSAYGKKQSLLIPVEMLESGLERGFFTITQQLKCPECGKEDIDKLHHEGNFGLPECDYYFCTDCEHQWGHS